MRLIRLLFAASVISAASAKAATFNWDGKTYIPLGLQSQSQAVLRFPERLSGYVLEEPESINVLTIDDRTLSFSPRAAAVEQRIILRGESGTLYMARASTSLRFYALLEVQHEPAAPEEAHGSVELPARTPVFLMLKLMQRRPPSGFHVVNSSRSLLQTAQFRLDSEQVWSGGRLTGIVATLQRTAAMGSRVEVEPERIEILIPALGELRMIAADRYVLDDRNPSTSAYLIFLKD